MNDPIVHYQVGTTLPVIGLRLMGESGGPLPIDKPGVTVEMEWEDPLDDTVNGHWIAPMQVVDVANSIVAYQPTSQDTAMPAEYLTRVLVTDPVAGPIAVPNEGHLRVRVHP